MVRKLGGLIVLAALAAPCSTNARDLEPPTVGGLAAQCRYVVRGAEGQQNSDVDDISGAMCLGYVMGESEGQLARPNPMYCAPNAVTIGQMVRIFLKWADSHPELHHVGRIYGLRASQIEAFPC